jgi:phosphohistidine phosphatase SixA
MLRIVLVRHGEREPGKDGGHLHLTPAAKEQAETFGRRLSSLCDPPTLILASRWKHALQTAQQIASGAGWNASPIREVGGLTPHSESSSTNHWADDQLYGDLPQPAQSADSIVLLVGHETRLSQLILRFTGKRRRPLEALEAACVQADDWKSLWLGQGNVVWRYPVRSWLEDELAEKITSKMTVATFLASANFIGLLELLIGQRQMLKPPPASSYFLSPADCSASIAGSYCSYLLLFEPRFEIFWLVLIAQLLAAGLFIATVYIYDRQTMPSGFWLLKPPWWIDLKNDVEREKLLLNGYPQALMVRVWSCVFTPAVFFSTLGILLLVATTGIGTLLVISILISLGVVWFFRRNRPTGNVD